MGLDRRFFEWRENVTLGEMASKFGFELSASADPNGIVTGLASASAAGAGDLCFVEGKSIEAAGLSAQPLLCFLGSRLQSDAEGHGLAYAVAPRPRWLFAQVANWLAQVKPWPSGEKNIDPSAQLEDGVIVGTGAVIGPGAIVGANTIIGPGSVIGTGVTIGRNVRIGAHCSLQCALVGDHVMIASGTRIGEAGFGTIAGSQGAEDMPQFGRVILQDHVSIGSNCCIDRGAFSDTILGERTKVDNLCQIGHNVVIGRSVVMAAFAGLSGTVHLGDGTMLGGRVGIADHVTVGPGAKLAADAAVMRDVPSGETWGGTPAKPFSQWMREVAWLQKQMRTRRSGDER